MVIRDYAECLSCGTQFILRVGIGIESVCTHTFDCPSCHSPISIQAKTGEPPQAWIELIENAKKTKEDPQIDIYINLHPSIASRPDEYHSRMAFVSMTYVKLVWPHLRAPASQRSQDAATEFEVPYTRELWPLINSILTLAAKGDPAGILDPQIGRYVKRRQEFSPNFGCKTAFKAVASFFDDIFHPAIGRLRHPLRYFAQAQIQIYSAEMKRFGDFYRNEIEQPNIERYLATLNDYFKHFDQFRQMLVHARVGDNEVDDFVVGSKSFNEIKLYYGQAYETLTSSYLTLACINNVAQGRPYDEFQSMTLSKYTKDLEKSKRSNPFKETPELAAFIRFEDSSLRNGSHHASIWRDGEIVKYKSGGTGAERDISYSRYLHQCNEITIALAALLLVELQMFSRLRPS